MKLLDCTFRDGGYYNSWDFSKELFQLYLNSIAKSGVSAIEVGFRFFPKEKLLGPFAYTTDEFLSDFILPHLTMVVMVNSKELAGFSKGPKKAVEELFDHSENSPVDMVRIAVNINDVEQSESIASELKERGYSVGCNLMQSAGKTDKEIEKAVTCVESWGSVDVLYFADSLGSMDAKEVQHIMSIAKNHWEDDIGFHAHNNQGKAVTNALAAFDAGATWIDGTILGMGRGAGNAETEYLLSEFQGKDVLDLNFDTSKAYPLVYHGFQELKDKYKWGPNIFYYVSAYNRIHPTYTQEMLSSITYSKEQIMDGLVKLSFSKSPNSYNEDRLRGAMMSDKVSSKIKDPDIKVKVVIPARYKSSRFPGKALVDLLGKSLVQRVWERCCLALAPEDVYVATEDNSIKEHCEALGINVIMTTSDCVTGTDRVYQASLNLEADLIVNVQGDEPLISPDDIIKIINAHIDNPEAVQNGMCSISSEEDFRRSSVPKVVADIDNNLMYISRGAVPSNKELGFPQDIARKQVCIYAFPKKALKDYGEYGKQGKLEISEEIEILRFLELGCQVEMVEVSDSSISVDYPEDVERVVKAIKEHENMVN